MTHSGNIVKQYEHFNKSLPNWDSKDGKYISSREHYERELKKGGFEPYTGKGQPEPKKWVPSDNIKKDLYHLKQMARRDGTIDPTNREQAKRLMEKSGVKFNPTFLPKE